jgi:L-lactate utilization protein LutB
MTNKKITKNLMKNISEMNHDEKRELLKKIEENRLEQIKKVKETLEKTKEASNSNGMGQFQA